MKRYWMPMFAGAVAVALSATPMLVKAQDTTTPPSPGNFKEFQQKMAERLNLTQEQQNQLKQIRENTRSQIEAVLTPEQQQKLQAAKQAGGRRRDVWASLNLTQEQKNQIKTIRQSAKQQMQSILTPEQQAQLQQMRQNRRARGQQRQSQ